MEQTPSNMPVMESKPGIAGWFSVWMKAVSKPSEQNYIEITESPEAKLQTAFIWVFIAATVAGVFSAILQTINSAIGVTPAMPPIPGLEEYIDPSMFQQGGAGSPMMTLVIGICSAPIAGLVSILFFALFTALYQWIGKLFGGVGTFEKLAYGTAAITFPYTIVSSILSLFTAIPFVGLCFSFISLGLALYVIVLQVYAIKAVNRFPSFGPAVGVVLIPLAVVFLFACACIALASVLIAGLGAGSGFAP